MRGDVEVKGGGRGEFNGRGGGVDDGNLPRGVGELLKDVFCGGILEVHVVEWGDRAVEGEA